MKVIFLTVIALFLLSCGGDDCRHICHDELIGKWKPLNNKHFSDLRENLTLVATFKDDGWLNTDDPNDWLGLSLTPIRGGQYEYNEEEGQVSFYADYLDGRRYSYYWYIKSFDGDTLIYDLAGLFPNEGYWPDLYLLKLE